jgi:hypothetical protein
MQPLRGTGACNDMKQVWTNGLHKRRANSMSELPQNSTQSLYHFSFYIINIRTIISQRPYHRQANNKSTPINQVMARFIISLLVLVLASLNYTSADFSPIHCSDSEVYIARLHLCRACHEINLSTSTISQWCNFCPHFLAFGSGTLFSGDVNGDHPRELSLLCEQKCPKLANACAKANMIATWEDSEPVIFVWLGQTMAGLCLSDTEAPYPKPRELTRQALNVLLQAEWWARIEGAREVEMRSRAERQMREYLGVGSGNKEGQCGKKIEGK